MFSNKWGLVSSLITYILLFALLLAPFAKKYAQEREEKEAQERFEIGWLAKAIYFEARGEKSLEAQKAVADVILTRVNDPRWPDSVEEVIRQDEERKNRCQFSFMCDGKPEHVKDRASWETALYVASVAYSAHKEGEKKRCAHSYHANYVKRDKFSYFMKLAPEEEVGSHIFYCD